MSEPQPGRALDAVAQKWRQLAERRRAHFVELFNSGRWKYYYNEEQYLTRMRETFRLAERWALIAPSPNNETPSEGAPRTVVPGAIEDRRDAA
jgi:uncharacterized repeat protein (TIGR03809 family)